MAVIQKTVFGLLASTFLTGAAFADPTLWRISDEDSEIYIFGTVHILRPDIEWQTDDVMAAFEAAETVYFEAPVNDPSEAVALQQAVMGSAFNAQGTTLSSLISEEAWAQIEAFAPQIGVSAAQLEPFRPWFATLNISVGFIISSGYQPNSGVESTLWPLASEAGKSLAYFETVEEQIGFFANMSDESAAELLEQTMAQIELAPDQLDALVTAWANGDQDTIDAVMNGQMQEETPELYDVIIVGRNEVWAEDIEALLAGSGSVFIAVGAGHLPGEEGVINLLRQRGIEVTGP